jgi:hypothetical protein
MVRLSRISLSLFLLVSLGFAAEEKAPANIPELVRKTVDNEVSKAPASSHFMFRGTETSSKGSTTKLYVESREGTAGMIVAYNGKPLTPDQKQAEEARVTRFLTNPEELKKKRKQEQEDDERAMRIIRAIPDAFLFDYAGEEPGTLDRGKSGDPLVRLKFRPNPKYNPPSHVEQLLTGMQGIMLIDAAQHRMALIDGTLFKDVGFGWGILGRLDSGGHFLVQQREIGPQRWEISRMNLNFNGKVLLVKHISINQTEVYGDFKQVPMDLTFAQALDMIKKEEATVAANPATSKLAEK